MITPDFLCNFAAYLLICAQQYFSKYHVIQQYFAATLVKLNLYSFQTTFFLMFRERFMRFSSPKNIVSKTRQRIYLSVTKNDDNPNAFTAYVKHTHSEKGYMNAPSISANSRENQGS